MSNLRTFNSFLAASSSAPASAAGDATAAAPPQATAVSPTKVPAAGGTPVTITGTGFTGATSVTFGAAYGGNKLPAQFSVDSDTQITATTPDAMAKFMSGSNLAVVVTTPAGSSPDDRTAPFVTFGDPAPAPSTPAAAPPQATAVSPMKVPAAGGTPVTITGTGFTGATSVTFGAAGMRRAAGG